MPKLDIKPDHIQGGFEWETAPSCECVNVQRMLDDKFLFAANISDMEAGGTLLYMLPLNSDGDVAVRRVSVSLTAQAVEPRYSRTRSIR
jgi:hypothetical protein